jgi:hypothetical protein
MRKASVVGRLSSYFVGNGILKLFYARKPGSILEYMPESLE